MGRKRGHKKKRQIIGIYCEGKSEEQYFKMLSQKYLKEIFRVDIL